MGQQVKYTGNSDIREIYKKDFDKVGVTDQDLVRFERGNQFTAEVSEDAAKYLVENEANFELVGSPSQASGDGDDDEEKGDPKKSTSGGTAAKRATSGDKK